MTIDASKKLMINHFKKFKKECGETIAISIDNDIVGEIDKMNFKEIFLSGLFSGFEDDMKIVFQSNGSELIINCKDYKKWSNPWWANRIFAEETKDAITKAAKETLKIECFLGKRKLDGGNVYDEISFTSSDAKEITRFINKNKSRLEIQARLENAEVVYLLRYVGDDNQFFRNEDELLLNGNFIL